MSSVIRQSDLGIVQLQAIPSGPPPARRCAPGIGYGYAMLVNPPLSINPVVNQTGVNQVLVSWPAWALNYVLQTTTNLVSPNWVAASNGVPMASVLLTNSLPNACHRLSWPQ